jgi:aryl-alcohol dehydrogenase-like predicted oxidoreductase
MMNNRPTRRGVLGLGVSAAVAACGGSTDAPSAIAPSGPLGTRPLGKTGLEVTMFGLGSQARLQFGTSADGVAIVQRALDRGVKYIDTAPNYGPSEQTIGIALAGRRDAVVLATKTEDRTRDGSLRLLDQSLTRLKTDHVDVWQIHDLHAMEELDVVFGPGGAIEALERARGDGRVRFLGITGHYDPDVLLEALRRYPFDTLLLALNVADGERRPFRTTLLPYAVDRGMGIIAMKVNAAGNLTGALRFPPEETFGYVLSLPVSCAILGCDTPEHVDANAARTVGFSPLAPEAMTALERRAVGTADQALYFRRV